MKIIAITNLSYFNNTSEFINHISKLDTQVDYIILREKLLNDQEYLELATSIQSILTSTKLIIHSRKHIADQLKLNDIHLSFNNFMQSPNLYKSMHVSISIHSIDEALILNNFNIYFIIASHVFQTECKSNSVPLGVSFIKKITNVSNHKVYALGGINCSNINLLNNTNINGVALMSSLMNPSLYKDYINILKSNYLML